MTDAEWPMIVYRIMKQPIHYIEVEGLEYWEATNSDTREVSEGEEWVGRLKLALIISESAITTGKAEAQFISLRPIQKSKGEEYEKMQSIF